ncbi:UDP-2,3-diacylglucosamine diphosphatase [Fuscovulum ytuae]|uniref:Metallophosphoesterase family protein n=1 Tax=Fuscovulum ytuae TaxID=3042299 RepID=A0ABY8Q3W5_9RHOB|nr:metallophosphoesterase [Fuscovulum sp. YMD61]WGV15553.1 metallophosphoesterase family protein [Fuscovulum sp. YMD61]
MEPCHLGRAQGQRHRALFLSDLHLGALGGRADLVAGFLEAHSADTIFLVGDIFDIWHPLVLRWGTAERRVVELLRQRAEEGSRLVYLRGNHDAPYMSARCKSGLAGEIELPVAPSDHAIHATGDGRRLLVIHGDVCDARPLRFHLLTRLGSRLDSLLLLLDSGLRRLRFAFGPHGRGPLKLMLSAVNDLIYCNRAHERRLVALARAQGLDGVVCGHFHIAALHEEHGPLYVNCGDWVDSFTAVVETWDGRLQLLGAAVEAGAASPIHEQLPAGDVA